MGTSFKRYLGFITGSSSKAPSLRATSHSSKRAAFSTFRKNFSINSSNLSFSGS